MRVFTVLVMLCALTMPALAQEDAPTVTVSGEGVVQAVPDMATITIGVTSEGDTARAAMDANNSQLATVIERLKAAGVEDRDVQSSGLSLGPRYDYSQTDASGQNQITGYMASNMVTVRVRVLANLGAVLDSAISDGANTLNGMTFGLQDPVPHLDEARKRAVADARRKAELYAAAMGIGLGGIFQFSEQVGYQPPMPMAYGGVAFDKAAAPVPVESGELTVTATVSITYGIAD